MLVAVVSKNDATRRDLTVYLKRAGIPAYATSDAHDPARAVPPNATAAVIFPDDFEDKVVVELLSSVRRSLPHLLLLLVTRDASRFHRAAAPDGRSLPPILLPRPSFGWDIVDAIRAHARAEAPR